MYKVEYADGKKSALSANLNAENMFAQIEEEGNRNVIMDNITDHWFDEASMKNQENFIITSSGTKLRRQTTKGISLCVKQSDGNTPWVDLKYLNKA